MKKAKRKPSFYDLWERVDAHEERIQRIEAIRLPIVKIDDIGAITTIMENYFGRKFTGKIWRNSKAVELAIVMLRRGTTYKEVVSALREVLGFAISKSSIARFWKICNKFGLSEREDQ